MRLGFGALVALLALTFVPVAGAAQRFAAPEGKGAEPCAQTAPCSLKDAISNAKAEDEVIVGAGSYSVTAAIFAPVKGLYVHGDFSGPMPRINASVPGPPISLLEGTHIAYLEVFNTAGEAAWGFFCTLGWRIERVRVQVLSANGTIGINQSESCIVRDSLILAQGPKALGLSVNGSTTVGVDRNLTVSATGAGSIGAFVSTSSVGGLDLRNTILAGDEFDLKVGNKSKAFVGSSSLDSSKIEPEGLMIDVGGNQTAAPLFVDAAKGDYREAAGSPTIDAGANDQLGPVDLAGSPRIIGGAVDIGAFEFVPPVGQLDSLAVKPRKFRAGNVAGAVASGGKKKAAPLGARVSFALSAPGTVEFHVEHAGIGRRVGKKCVKKTAANKSHKTCVIYKPLKGRFSVPGAAGANSFKFSGRLGGKALKPGPYRIVGSAGDAIRRAAFTIVK
jgi:hypothetical protein